MATSLSRDGYDVLVAGAGYAGTVIAERFASRCGMRVLVVDRRNHIAGNAYDYVDAHGVRVHAYGPHIFHTRSQLVVTYLSQFTDWTPYRHRVVAEVDGRHVPIPINRTTVNELYGLALTSDEEVETFFAARREPIQQIRNSEDAVVAKVGRDLFEKLFRGYTRKQWERDPSELHASVCGRIPVRTNTDDGYFSDWHQAMPADGYTPMFERMLSHPNIEVSLGTSLDEVRAEVEHRHLVYTGPIDVFFGCRFGELPYRSLEWELRNVPTPDGGLVLPASSVNYPSEDVPHTRMTEFRRLTGQSPHPSSTLAVEFPRAEGDPYYPIPRDDTRTLYRKYEALASELDDVTFVGRLARYQYLNMDQVVGQALSTFAKLVGRGVGRIAAETPR